MKMVLQDIRTRATGNQKMLAVLIDPEKFDPNSTQEFLSKIPSKTTHIFIGGSTATAEDLEACVIAVKAEITLPVVLFPGDHQQISAAADAVLFLSLLSGRNPEYLIGQQLRSVPLICSTQLEVIPTAYLLIDGGKECAVQRVSHTKPLCQKEPQIIVNTALAGKFSGKQLIYLEAGSGALTPVAPGIIKAVKDATELPVVVGGGINNSRQLNAAYSAGAAMVVIGSAFENGLFFE